MSWFLFFPPVICLLSQIFGRHLKILTGFLSYKNVTFIGANLSLKKYRFNLSSKKIHFPIYTLKCSPRISFHFVDAHIFIKLNLRKKVLVLEKFMGIEAPE